MSPLWILVAGPVSAPDEASRRANLARLAREALAIQAKGHLPIVAHFLAEPLRASDRAAGAELRYVALCRSLAERCDAIYQYAASPGSDAERAEFEARGRPVYTSLAQVPQAPRN
jgi:hypothetical protein